MFLSAIVNGVYNNQYHSETIQQKFAKEVEKAEKKKFNEKADAIIQKQK